MESLLQEFGIKPPVFIRKLDKRSDWNPEVSNPLDRPRRSAELIFRDAGRIFSLYRVESDRDFCSAVTAISANRSPQNQNLDFIWMTANDLNSAGIPFELSIEGRCLQAGALHYNATIRPDAAISLCRTLLIAGRQDYRCGKRKTGEILEQRRLEGCHAVVFDSEKCLCER
ncbi:MAG: hypothetical protein MUC48_03450 [Leptolyngbya sp. Prado105]|jgi:hypothetical protein|nr:hypothetical protein [Leptolyngbya sp. Prado105]